MNLSKEQYEREVKHPEILRSCGWCAHITEALSLWCSNKDAIKYRGTSIPGCVHCPFWAPTKEAKKIMARNATKAMEGNAYYGFVLI